MSYSHYAAAAATWSPETLHDATRIPILPDDPGGPCLGHNNTSNQSSPSQLPLAFATLQRA